MVSAVVLYHAASLAAASAYTHPLADVQGRHLLSTFPSGLNKVERLVARVDVHRQPDEHAGIAFDRDAGHRPAEQDREELEPGAGHDRVGWFARHRLGV